MNLQLVYRYILSLSKNENMFYEKNKTKQKPPPPPKKSKRQKEKKRKESFHRRESNPGPSTYKVNALSMKFCGSTLFEAGIALFMRN